MVISTLKAQYGPWVAEEVVSGEALEELALPDRRIAVCTYPNGSIYWFAVWRTPDKGEYAFETAQGDDVDALKHTLAEHFDQARAD